MRFVIFAAIVVLTSSTVEARDDEHLIPEDSFYSDYRPGDNGYFLEDYYKSVLTVLSRAYDQDTFGRVIVLPSFQNEYAVALSKKDDLFEVMYVAPQTSIWTYYTLKELEAALVDADEDEKKKLQADIRLRGTTQPDSLADFKVDVCEREIPTYLGEKLYVLWGEMLYRTRYPDRRPISFEQLDFITVRTDGISFHFSFGRSLNRLAGSIWSPSPESNTGRMVEIVRLLKQSCIDAGRDNDFDQIQKLAESLLSDLSLSDY